MKWFKLLRRVEHNDNTAEYGYGDFPKTTWQPCGTFAARSLRSAQALQNRRFGLKFSGRFPAYRIVEEES